jgi:hypothetical protein
MAVADQTQNHQISNRTVREIHRFCVWATRRSNLQWTLGGMLGRRVSMSAQRSACGEGLGFGRGGSQCAADQSPSSTSMTTADSCPTKCSTTRTVCHLRIATHVLVIPGQTVACRREPPSPRARIGFTRLRSWVRVPQRPPSFPWSKACASASGTVSDSGVRATRAVLGQRFV